jgi:hypothetical protein
VTQTIEEKNKAFVLEAFDTLFNKRDYAAAERFWSPNYIQHSAHIPPGREGLFAHLGRERPILLRPRKTGVGHRRCRNGNLQTKRRFSPTPSGTLSSTHGNARPRSRSGNDCDRPRNTILWRCAGHAA